MTTGGAQTAVIELESRLLRTEFRNSNDFLENILHDDFLEVGASGRFSDKKQTIDLLTSETGFSSVANDFRFFPIAESVALLTYTLKTMSPETGTRHSIRSSVWKLENDKWRLVFHQGTETDPLREEG